MTWQQRARYISGQRTLTPMLMPRFHSRSVTLLSVLLATACVPPAPPAAAPPLRPATHAERTGYAETSSHADMLRFVDSLRALGAPVHVTSLGTSASGRDIPLLVASRPLVRSSEEARRLGRPVVYVQGGIHGGEVEGKEALLALLRDLTLDPRPNPLDSVVLLAVPLYNPDGNDRFGPQQQNRWEQNGPARVGERANGQGLDLNRDYIKAVAPETRATMGMLNAWRPDLFVDLHATNGSYHGYALTYAPSLTPASEAAGVYARDRLLPELRRRMRARHGMETFDYGNFSLRYGADVNTDTTREGWYTYDARPRFGTNYFGLRGGIAILSEAYSHDPLRRRVESTHAFVREILSLAAERGAEVLALTRGGLPAGGRPLPLRSELTRTPYQGEVISEDLVLADSGVVTEPGVPAGLRRSGRFRTLHLPVHDRFDGVREIVPPAGYLLGPELAEAVRLLRLHGVAVRQLDVPTPIRGEAFRIDSVAAAPRPFQGHHEVRLEGRWREVATTAPPGAFYVSTDQPLGVLAAYLLEPESEDGIATWSRPAPGAPAAPLLLPHAPRPGADFPVLRVR